MAGVRDLKQKIKSVNNISQITRAMKMIAASRIKKVELINKSSKPYSYKIREMTIELVNQTSEAVNPLMEYRDPVKALNIVITADKGLCGSYNHSIIKFAQAGIKEQQISFETIALGIKAYKYFGHRNFNLIDQYLGWAPSYSFAKQLAAEIAVKFISKEIDEVNCFYVKSITSLSHAPVVEKVLPIKTEKTAAASIDYIFEPDKTSTLDVLLKRYLEVTVYSILLEAKTTELVARLHAMTNATDNAEKLSSELTLQYFRARQEAITNEILEVAGGVEALKK
ncbi:MAG: ATP synthase F1 subunit gamma [Armatimonadota bacterium]